MGIHEESITRMAQLKHGDPVTNICAGAVNPRRHAFFVAYTVKAYKNQFGMVHHDHWAKCTDKKGRTWNIGIESIHPGHLDAETSAKLWAPVWQERYGAAPTGQDQGAGT